MSNVRTEQRATTDVLIVGAGLSGVGAACQLRQECPDKSVIVLEARDAIGGTWDLFRYPGIRSDSDMFTLGYRFRPWTDPKAIADGPSILRYIHDTAQEFDVEQPHSAESPRSERQLGQRRGALDRRGASHRHR